MSRTIQIGDVALVNGQPFIVRGLPPQGIMISPTQSSPQLDLLIFKDGSWQVQGYTVPHTVTFAPPLDSCDDFEKIILSPEEIRQRRQVIYDQMMPYLLNDPNRAGEMTDQHLLLIFQLYDHLWFQGRLKRYFDGSEHILNVVFGKGTSIGGSCKILDKGKVCHHTISISRPVFSGPFANSVETVNGLQCTNHLYCLQLVFEHELIHLILNLWCRDKQGHGPDFKRLAKNLFGHTEHKHMIGRGMDEDPAIYIVKVKEYLKPGLIVSVKQDTGATVKYHVVKVDKKTFLGVNQTDQKRYRVAMHSVVLPGEDEETEEEFLPVTHDLEKIRNYLRPGMVVRTKDGEEYRVYKVDRTRFVGTSLKDHQTYRVNMLAVILPGETVTPVPSTPPVARSKKDSLQEGMIVSVKDGGKYEVISVNRRANAKNFVGRSLKDQKEYRVPYELLI